MTKTAMDIILEKVDRAEDLTREDALTLLNVSNESADFYRLLEKANHLSRTEYKKRGYIFAQIGLNSAPCPGNCKFCSLARSNYSIEADIEKSEDEIYQEARTAIGEGIDALFLMTTANYDIEKFFKNICEGKEAAPGGRKIYCQYRRFR